ncbi:hypothetical protein ACQJBY_070135 [Aegilops geniculata]
MDDNSKSAHIIRELEDKHLQSVVSLTAWWKGSRKEGRELSVATGSIIHSSKIMLVLGCAHIFQSFITCYGPGFDTALILNGNITIRLNFFDGHSAEGRVYCIDWWKDLCLVLVPVPNKLYESVKFIEDENMMSQSVYTRGEKVFSIFCLPTHEKDCKLLFGTIAEGEISGLPITANDFTWRYHSDLEFFEFAMSGAGGASGGPIFTKNMLVMGILLGGCDGMKFAVKIHQIRRWILDCFNIKRTKNMNETVAKLSADLSARWTKKAESKVSSRRGLA